MISQSFENFDWDEGNREKCLKHGVSINEIEEAMTAEAMMILPDLKHSDKRGSFHRNGEVQKWALFIRGIHPAGK